jgi:hypothetical protein
MPSDQQAPVPSITSSRQAFAAISLAALACDKAMDRDEVRMLKDQLLSRPVYASMGDGDLSEMFEGLLADLRHFGTDCIVRAAIPLLSQHQCETSLAVVTQLILSNGDFSVDEKNFIDSLASLMGLEVQRSSTIVEVISLLFSDV